MSARSPNAPAISVCCLATRDEGDEVAGMMLVHLLVQAGYDAHVAAVGPHKDMLDEVEEQVCGILYLSALPPFEISAIRRLYKRLLARFPQIRIGIGLWGYDGGADNMRVLLRIVDSDLIVTSLGEGVVQIQQFTELVARSR